MSLANCERLLEHYESAAKDSSLTEQARINAKFAAEDMKKHIAQKKKLLGVEEKSSKAKK